VVVGAVVGALVGVVLTFPLAWKWRLRVLRIGPAVGLLGLFAAAIAIACGSLVDAGALPVAGIACLLTLLFAAAALAYCFFRDPERASPDASDVIVSPADGEVLYVGESEGGLLPIASKDGRRYTLQELTKTPLARADAVVVGIGLSLLDVHVNRAPVAGRIALLRRFPGRFGSLRRPEMVFENERATMVIEHGSSQVAVVLIASRLVRRIVTFVSEGDHVAVGQRLGMIRFGSQVDLVLPARTDVDVCVRPGDHVRAGESIIAVLREGIDGSGLPVEPTAAMGGVHD
jgi:phosphatidylserine decarboxylase